MNDITNKTVAFIGDKILRTPDDSSDVNLTNVVRTELQFVVEDLLKEDNFIFLTAISAGFDMLAAEVIVEYAERFPRIELHAVIPSRGYALCYSDADRLRYKRIYESVSNHIYIRDEDGEDADKLVTEYLISNSSEVVLFNRETNPVVEKLAGDKAWNMYQELDAYFAVDGLAKGYLQKHPKVPSFRYSKDGLIFEGNNQPFPVVFEQIVKIIRIDDAIIFFLIGGLKIIASLTTNDCRILFNRNTGNWQ